MGGGGMRTTRYHLINYDETGLYRLSLAIVLSHFKLYHSTSIIHCLSVFKASQLDVASLQ